MKMRISERISGNLSLLSCPVSGKKIKILKGALKPRRPTIFEPLKIHTLRNTPSSILNARRDQIEDMSHIFEACSRIKCWEFL